MSTGVLSFTIHSATLVLGQDNAIPAIANVTIDAGALNFNGHADNLGNLLVKNNGQAVVTTISNHTTTVASGTLTANSIICGTLTIGATAAGANPADAPGTALTKNAPEPLAANVIASVSDEHADARPRADNLAMPSPLASPAHREQPIPGETVSANSLAATKGLAGDPPLGDRLEAIVAAVCAGAAISLENTPVMQSVRNVAPSKLETDAVDSLPQSPNYGLPACNAFPAKSVETSFANLFFEKPSLEDDAHLPVAKQEKPAFAESIEKRIPAATSNSRQAHFAALQSVIHEYRERNLDGYSDYGFIHRNHALKQTTSSKGTVDLVLALDEVFGERIA